MKIVTNETRKIQVRCSVTSNMFKWFEQQAEDNFSDLSRIIKSYLIDGLIKNGIDPKALDLGAYPKDESNT